MSPKDSDPLAQQPPVLNMKVLQKHEEGLTPAAITELKIKEDGYTYYNRPLLR